MSDSTMFWWPLTKGKTCRSGCIVVKLTLLYVYLISNKQVKEYVLYRYMVKLKTNDNFSQIDLQILKTFYSQKGKSKACLTQN